MIVPMEDVEVVVAHRERVTLRVGDVYLKVDGDDARLDREVAAMALVPSLAPTIRWRQPSVLAIEAVRGTPLARLGEPSAASPTAWSAAGAAVRSLHDAPLPPWSGKPTDELAAHLARECEWLATRAVLPAEVIGRNRRLAEAVLRPWHPVFVHGDLQVEHVLLDGDAVVGIIDWSEAAPGDALWDLATLTIGHPEHLDDVLAGYGCDVDRDLIRGWWSLRCLSNIRWLSEHGYGDIADFPETAVLRRA